jgi:heme exporter protein A
MLAVKELHCERNRRVLFDDLTFSVAAGEALRVLGSNGCGKTTLLRMLCGLYQDYEGDIEWELADYPLFVGHRPGVKDLLTAAENLHWLAALYGSRPSADAIAETLTQVGLKGYEHVPCGALSEGQRKRVNLARLYLLASPAWILDEPFSSIDVAGVDRLQQRMDQHLAGGGLIILTTHQSLNLMAPVRTIELGAFSEVGAFSELRAFSETTRR